MKLHTPTLRQLILNLPVLVLPVLVLPMTVGCGNTALAPTITSQPLSLTVNVGEKAVFSVTALAGLDAAYQWHRNGQAISGATSATYTIEAVSASDDQAIFTVVVSNAAGSVTSSEATLTVKGGASVEAPTLQTQPQDQAIKAGQNATFQVVATGNPTYQWRRNGQDIPGANAASYTLSKAQLSDNGATFSVFLSNAGGSLESASARLTVSEDMVVVAPVITTHPQSVTTKPGLSASFKVVATGTPSPAYQWQRDGQNIPGATLASYEIAQVQEKDNGAQFTVKVSNEGGSLTSNAATLNVTLTNGEKPTISQQPLAQTVKVGETATFTVGASGDPQPSYQWRRNGEAVDGATSATFSIPNAQLTDDGASVDVLVFNKIGKTLSTAVKLTVKAATESDIAPYFTTQPQSITTLPGKQVAFEAKAEGKPAPTYQWLKNGSTIPGATQARYTFTAQKADNGARFSVQATNAAGSATSSEAKVTVNAETNPGGNCTVTFIQEGNGSLSGELNQSVQSGGSCTPVIAKADAGHMFNFWVVDGRIIQSPELKLDTVSQSTTATAHFVAVTKKVVGEMMPNFRGIGEDGRDVSVADYHGQVIMLDMGYFKCGGCKEESKKVEEWYQKNKNTGIKVLGLLHLNDTYKACTPEDLKSWKDMLGLTFTYQNDATVSSGEKVVSECFTSSYGNPCMVIIDKDFKIRAVNNFLNKVEKVALDLAKQ